MAEKVEYTPPGMILAGGLSRRMGGGDKGLLLLGGRPILDHVIARLRPQVSALVLNANGDPSRFAAFGLEIVPDNLPGFAGPLAGILTGLDWMAQAQPDADHLLTVPSDTPFLPCDLVARLQSAIRDSGDSAVAESGGRRHPVVGLWSRTAREELRRMLEVEGARKVEAWIGRIGARSVGFDCTPVDPFFNINNADDLAAAERLRAAATP